MENMLDAQSDLVRIRDGVSRLLDIASQRAFRVIGERMIRAGDFNWPNNCNFLMNIAPEVG